MSGLPGFRTVRIGDAVEWQGVRWVVTKLLHRERVVIYRHGSSVYGLILRDQMEYDAMNDLWFVIQDGDENEEPDNAA